MIGERFATAGTGLAEVFLRNRSVPFLAQEVSWERSCVRVRGYFPKLRMELDDEDRVTRVFEPRPAETVSFPIHRIEHIRETE